MLAMFMHAATARAAVISICVYAAAATAQAAPAANVAQAAIVTSGNARFEVLAPGLIRTEYAGDGAFADGATFNAIGRDGFGTPASFTATTANGCRKSLASGWS